MPRVTEILDGVYHPRRPAPGGGHAEYGHEVHAALAEGKPKTVPDVLATWRRFERETGAETLAIELEVEHNMLGYRGRLDRIILLKGKTWVVDFKSGCRSVTDTVQVNLYHLAAASMGFTADRLGVFYITSKRYNLMPCLRRWAQAIEVVRLYAAKEGT